MVALDPDAFYHRTLGDQLAKLPYIDYEVRKDAFEEGAKRVGWTLGTAYTIRNKKLVPLLYVLKKDQDFKTYATRWEIAHSKLAFGTGSGTSDPVVDDNMTVVGHVGWFDCDSIFVPQKEVYVTRKVTVMERGQSRSILGILTDRDPLKASEENRRNITPRPVVREVTRGLGEMLSDGVHIYADKAPNSYMQQGYVRPLPPQTGYRLVTDLEGRVLFVVEVHDREAVEPSWVSPLDLIAIGKMVYLVGRAVAGLVAVRILARAAAVRLMRGAARELETATTEELLAARGGVNTGRGAAGEAAGGAGGRGATRTTLRGIGAAGAGGGGGGFRRLFGKVTADEMEAYLREVLARRPDLRRLMAARVMTGQGRMDAIQIALKEFERTQGWKVVEKPAAVMEAAGIERDNIVSMRAELRELWINNERAARFDPDDFYDHVVHDLSAHALVGRGGRLDATVLPFIGESFSRANHGLFILEQAIKQGDLEQVIAIFRDVP
jgi:hypothetical protein